jgi:hypothetical protein
MRVYGGYTGIRDFALASTDNNFVDDVLEDEDEIRS